MPSSAFESVRQQLETARANGQPFDAAWDAAVAHIRGLDGEVLAWSKPVW